MQALPSYLNISEKQWQEKLGQARSLILSCKCCPHYCQVNRTRGEKGRCGAGNDLYIAGTGPHFGEEPPISGTRGSGNIFFSFCSMKCVYCQNYPFSQRGHGRQKEIDEFISIMLDLQKRGCHNINLVTPAHFIPQIIFAIKGAIAAGLHIPIVYNTSSFESLEGLLLMEGIADIYLANMRYADPEMALRYSGVKEYPEMSRLAVKEMLRQVGPLLLNEEGIAQRGLIIRHLVLPAKIAGSKKTLEFIAKEISKIVPVSIMNQYFPTNRAAAYPEINRPITGQEYEEVVELMDFFGLREGWIQEEGK